MAWPGSPSSRPAVPPASGAQFPQPRIPNLRSLAKLKIPIPKLKDPKLKIPKLKIPKLKILKLKIPS